MTFDCKCGKKFKNEKVYNNHQHTLTHKKQMIILFGDSYYHHPCGANTKIKNYDSIINHSYHYNSCYLCKEIREQQKIDNMEEKERDTYLWNKKMATYPTCEYHGFLELKKRYGGLSPFEEYALFHMEKIDWITGSHYWITHNSYKRFIEVRAPAYHDLHKELIEYVCHPRNYERFENLGFFD